MSAKTDPPPKSDEHPTSVPCLACGGHHVTEIRAEAGKFSTVMCRWCSNGGMSPEQIARWIAHETSRKS